MSVRTRVDRSFTDLPFKEGEPFDQRLVGKNPVAPLITAGGVSSRWVMNKAAHASRSTVGRLRRGLVLGPLQRCPCALGLMGRVVFPDNPE